MPRFTLILSVALTVWFFCCQNPPASTDPGLVKKDFIALPGTPTLDGSGADDLWGQADWQFVNQVWLGKTPKPDDFSGRYKLAWDENNIYILAEITDDSLVDTHEEAPEGYWDDDGLVIFIDEDLSGGEHAYNYNAFAYNIDLNGQVMDLAPDSTCRFFNDHCFVRRVTKEHVSTWEIALRVFDGKQFQENAENVPKLLKKGKKIGFALAYNDNDHSSTCENSIGNIPLTGKNYKNAWFNANALGTLTLQ